MHALWPKAQQLDQKLLAAATYIRQLVTRIRSTEDAIAKKKSKKTGGKTGPSPPSHLTLFVADTFPKWQEDVIEILKKSFDGKEFKGDRDALVAAGLVKDKRVMPFAASIKV
jgi:leucyl-tRNA synthetase